MKLSIANLSFIYPEGGEILRDVSLEAEGGKIVAVMGPSGCGKSTLLNLVANLLTPRNGTVRLQVDGTDQAVTRVGYVFQSASLLPWLTIENNALFGVMLAGRGKVSIAQREDADAFLERYGLRAKARAYPAMLSGGMQLRVALIRAVLPASPILLLDEPFAGSDLILRETLEADVCRVVEERSLVTILVTHDLEQAIRLADRIVVLTPPPAMIAAVLEISESREQRRQRGKDTVLAMEQYHQSAMRVLRRTRSAVAP